MLPTPPSCEEGLCRIRRGSRPSNPRGARDQAGRIVARHFLGNIVDYRIALADGTVISVQVLGGSAPPAEGPVSVKVDPSKAWLLQ